MQRSAWKLMKRLNSSHAGSLLMGNTQHNKKIHNPRVVHDVLTMWSEFYIYLLFFVCLWFTKLERDQWIKSGHMLTFVFHQQGSHIWETVLVVNTCVWFNILTLQEISVALLGFPVGPAPTLTVCSKLPSLPQEGEPDLGCTLTQLCWFCLFKMISCLEALHLLSYRDSCPQ